MGFKIYSVDDGHVPGIEYLAAGAFTPKVGMALTQTDGLLNVASGTNAPLYISMCEKENPCSVGDIIPVIRVSKDMIFETIFSASAGNVKPGHRVTLHTDGMQVTATTSGGVAEVIYIDGTESGSMCRVRF